MKRADTENRGFTLLYSLLVISVVLLITSSIFSILLKEVRLTAFGKASQVAYYASEAGAECALFYAVRGELFDGTNTITCGYGEDEGTASGDITNVGNTFAFFLEQDEPACAVVTIDTSGPTVIESRGYNICIEPFLTGQPNARRVERGLRVEF